MGSIDNDVAMEEEQNNNIVAEGAAEILPIEGNEVFYNPVQVQNRDISVLAIDSFHKLREAGKIWRPKQPKNSEFQSSDKLRVLEALAASGLRTCRYAKELDCVEEIVANDLSSDAVKHIKRNLEHNNLSEDSSNSNGSNQVKVRAQQCDALLHMYQCAFGLSGGQYDVVDLDPYGSVAPFLDAAVQAVKNGGLLCITSTDSAVLCGKHPEVAAYKYNGTPVKAEFHHEAAIRLLLYTIESAAAKYGKSIKPLLSVSFDFYYRVFVQVRESAQQTKRHGVNSSIVLQCNQCSYFATSKMGHVNIDSKGNEKYKNAVFDSEIGGKCPECGGKYNLGGPIFNGPLYDKEFLNYCRQQAFLAPDERNKSLFYITTWPKLQAVTQAMFEEIETPLFYHLAKLFSKYKIQTPPIRKFKSALQRLGYEVSHWNREPQAIKTNAPNAVVFDLVRAWAKLHPPKKMNDLAKIVLEKEIKNIDIEKVDFSEISDGRGSVLPNGEYVDKVPMFLPNPEKYWGPKKAAAIKRKNLAEGADEKTEIATAKITKIA
eukprot:gene839-269_t